MNARLNAWVEECAALCRPDGVRWCDGSDAEYQQLVEGMLADGTLQALNQREYPGCYLHRSHPNDVARVENLTFICSRRRQDAGPTNHWMDPVEAKVRLTALFSGCMRGRTLYVVPYVLGPVGSSMSQVGVEITDSPYVAASLRIMTRMGRVALDQLGSDGDFVPGLHSTGTLDPDQRYICHFPEERLIWSYGSGYGGNALLSKKCFALRIASVQARDEGWLAEHMLLLELTDPTGASTYFAAAFPSACGKTNLAMLVSPLEMEGYAVRTVGDDIAWMRIGEDGRLWAVNPEAGFFGVAPGTSWATNPNAMATIQQNTIYTNVAVTEDGLPWWEGKDEKPPGDLIDWQGRRWSGEASAAHPNSRFTVPARQCPSISPRWEAPEGVPIDGILFGGRRNYTVPLVFEAFNWQHGTFLGATMASRTTAAATGAANILRRDPMAMLPFCGYNLGDYLGHWLAMGRRIPRPPKLFHVNWFRRDEDGSYLWPGFGENVRALIWMQDRIKGRGKAVETPIGLVPTPDALPGEGLKVAPQTLARLLEVDPAQWEKELPDIEALFTRLGERLPPEMWDELAALRSRLAL